MLDVAEHEGRTSPSARERGSAIAHGLGFRMDAASALGASLIGLLLAAVAGALSMWGSASLAAAGLWWVLPLLTVAVVPALASFGLIAIGRQRGFVSAPRALAAAVLALVALGLAFLAQCSWSLGFDLADEGLPSTGLAAAFVPLFLAAWLTGAAAVAVLIDGAFAGTGLPRAAASLIAALCGAIAAPVIGISLISPFVSMIAVAGVAILSLTLLRPRAAAERAAPAPIRLSRAIPARTRRLARQLAWISVAGGVTGVVYALTGTAWSAGASDGTMAVAQGISLAALSGLPFLGAVALIAGGRRPRSLATWGPLALVALSLAAIGVAYLWAPSWDAMAPALSVSAALTGAAIAWWLAARLPGPAAVRILTAALLGLGYAAFLGTMLAPGLVLLLPLAAVAFAIWGTRDPRPATAGPQPVEGIVIG